MSLSRQRRADLGHLRRRFAEGIGSDRFSHVGRAEIEEFLTPLLPGRGFFVEAGANDGIWQSNTYILERRGWAGLLVEPIPELHRRCRRNRRRARVVNCALVAEGHAATTVPMVYAGLMSIVAGAQGSAKGDERHVTSGERTQSLSRYSVDVPARTLSAILDETGAPAVDLLSLDVEGFELEALRGLDLERHRPALVLVEADDEERAAAIAAHLAPAYEPIGQPTAIDYAFRARPEPAARPAEAAPA